MNAPTGIIDIRGKAYKSVALRVTEFRADHPNWELKTDVVERTEDCVVMRCIIADDASRILATGHAEEYRRSSQINKTSALENAETSAIGRALAAMGYGGTEFASANEVENAIHQQAAGNGDGGHSRESAVSHRPQTNTRDAPFPQGPAKNKTELKAMGRELWREVEGCGDDIELSCLLGTDENVKLVAQLKEALPAWWDGYEKDGDPQEGLADVIARKTKEFTAKALERAN